MISVPRVANTMRCKMNSLTGKQIQYHAKQLQCASTVFSKNKNLYFCVQLRFFDFHSHKLCIFSVPFLKGKNIHHGKSSKINALQRCAFSLKFSETFSGCFHFHKPSFFTFDNSIQTR